MSLSESFQTIKPTIVAFTQKYEPVYDVDKAPTFPTIIGTGFVIREDGLILTNRHVVHAFKKAFRPPKVSKDDWGVNALMFRLTDAGMLQIPLKILGIVEIDAFGAGKSYYGDKKGPDVAIVHVKARGLPVAQLGADKLIKEGESVFTAGFPMGTDALTAPGYLHQLTPTLQAGIVSAVLPFPCSSPHAITINIMTQGGASGSPVCRTETGKVIGILYAGLHDLDVTMKNKDVYRVPTNVSYVVPSHYIVHLLENIDRIAELKQPSDAKTIEEMISGGEIVNKLENKLDVREIDEEPA